MRRCEYCDEPAYETLDGDYFCLDCMMEQVVTKSERIVNEDAVIAFLKDHSDEFKDFVLNWFTQV